MFNSSATFKTSGLIALAILLLPATAGLAQEKEAKRKTEYIEATAMGSSTQMGKMVTITISIQDYSTADDQRILLEAFAKAGSDGLYNALSKMKSKGHIAITGTLGFDVSYIRQFPTADGRRIRLVTNRPITFGEAWYSSRSKEYDLSAVEIELKNDKKKSSGTLLPACKFKINKEKELQLDLLQNPWKLSNIRETK